ncbi:MAG TPA: hypothetical protein PLF21_00330 [Exilispira sp.]|nr:hypothetical protein [Exilispira sp.]
MKIRLKEKNKKKSDKKRFPIFYAGRIVIVSLILFYLLTSSIFVNIFIKAAASFLYEEKIDIMMNQNPSESDISKFSVPIRLMLRIAIVIFEYQFYYLFYLY